LNRRPWIGSAPESSDKIDIDRFIPYTEVDPVYFNKSYYLVPDGDEDAYSLLRKALKETGRAGLGKFTLRTKEYPVLVHFYRETLALTTLSYEYEVIPPEDLEMVGDLDETSKDELELAIKIIDQLKGEFDLSEYKDTFSLKVKELAEERLKGKAVEVAEERPPKEEIKELMQALQETLEKLDSQQSG
jgi:DNA end-binding protein Ku